MGRRLGQHFLTDPAILDRIVDALDPAPDDVVIEIGPGHGTLTARLAPRVGRVIAIEKDRRLAEQLDDAVRRAAGHDVARRVSAVEGDALRLDWQALAGSPTGPARGAPLTPVKVVGNIPYYITSPLIERALAAPPPRVVVLLVQREVAERLAAQPGGKTYGALTVGDQAVAHVELLFVVRAGSFAPPPAVDSAVVRFMPLATPLVGPERQAQFRRFVTALFGQRRKQLVRSLRSVAGLERDEAAALLTDTEVDPASRPEVLSPQALVRLFLAVAR